MDETRLNRYLAGLDPGEAAELREFALREPWEQNLHIYREVKALKNKPITQRLYDFGVVGAWIAYVLFDQRGQLP